MSAPEDISDELLLGWGLLVWPLQTEGLAPDQREIGRLFRLGPVPKFARDWLANMHDPPRGDLGEFKFVLKRHRAKTFQDKYQKYRQAVAVRAVMACGLSKEEAFAEIMPEEKNPHRVMREMKPILDYIEQHPDEMVLLEKLWPRATTGDKK